MALTDEALTKTLGEQAYAAYCVAVHFRTWDGRPVLKWDMLPGDVKLGWEKAAAKVWDVTKAFAAAKVQFSPDPESCPACREQDTGEERCMACTLEKEASDRVINMEWEDEIKELVEQDDE